MKKILSILGIIKLTSTNSTSLVACNKQYSEDKLKELKEKNKINTKDQTIRDNLEWIAPQEKPFNQIDNKYYFVVWRGDKNDNWKINKFKNDTYLSDGQNKNIELKNNYQLYLYKAPYFSIYLVINKINNPVAITQWRTDKNKTYFKFVYCWDGNEQKLPNLYIDKNGNIKVDT